MRQAYVASLMMVLTTVAFSGCLSDDDSGITQADVDAARTEGNDAGYTAGFAAGSGDPNATVITPGDVTAAGTANYTAGFAAGEAAAASVSTLDTIIAAGTMKCGVKT